MVGAQLLPRLVPGYSGPRARQGMPRHQATQGMPGHPPTLDTSGLPSLGTWVVGLETSELGFLDLDM